MNISNDLNLGDSLLICELAQTCKLFVHADVLGQTLGQIWRGVMTSFILSWGS